jgi:hypothetical protein
MSLPGYGVAGASPSDPASSIARSGASVTSASAKSRSRTAETVGSESADGMLVPRMCLGIAPRLVKSARLAALIIPTTRMVSSLFRVGRNQYASRIENASERVIRPSIPPGTVASNETRPSNGVRGQPLASAGSGDSKLRFCSLGRLRRSAIEFRGDLPCTGEDRRLQDRGG